MNDLENLPFFLVAGMLFILTEPPLALAKWLLYGYVVSRFLHFAAYATALSHDTRATLWTIGSLILIFMTCWTLWLAMDAALIRAAGTARFETANVRLQDLH